MAVTNAETDPGKTITVTKAAVSQLLTKKALLYDKNGEEHYNLISALHKSMRNSDVDAAVYWLARMLEAGEDPLYIARRLVRFASEDIGMADSRALEICTSVFQACQFIGMPECTVHLTHAVVYLSLAPKSNALYTAYEAAKKDATETLAEPVPLQIRNGVTDLMQDLGYGKDYQYAHNNPDKLTTMQTMPDNLKGKQYYHPTDQAVKPRFRRAWRRSRHGTASTTRSRSWKNRIQYSRTQRIGAENMVKILAVNAGSSTLKWKLFEMPAEQMLADGLIDRLGQAESSVKIKYGDQVYRSGHAIRNYHEAVADVMTELKDLGWSSICTRSSASGTGSWPAARSSASPS